MNYLEYRYIELFKEFLRQEKEELFLLSATRRNIEHIISIADENPQSDFAKKIYEIMEKGV